MVTLSADLVVYYDDGTENSHAKVLGAVVQDNTLNGAIVELGRLIENAGKEMKSKV
jgi:hypothetical protein